MRFSLKYLDQIPQLKNFSVEQLAALAEEIRHKIIQVLSVNGGHLSSNLGTIELSIALHYVFNSPVDRFLFDVSHQTYTHKILTGRLKRFATIRKFSGLCGFADPQESEHDHFYAGHAGTALSLGLGMAFARDLEKKNEHVIPILGDAALTCGVTLEALNNIPKNLKNFVVILNDNNMSISENVGNIKDILNTVTNTAEACKSPWKKSEKKRPLAEPFFQQFGLEYTGPIDGHDLEKLLCALQAAYNQQKPLLLHVITRKGNGMPIAVKNPTCYHGVKPFDSSNGQFLKTGNTPLTFPKVFGQHLCKMAEIDRRMVAITPAMPAGSCLTKFLEKYPERCLDVGIAESHSVTFAAGIAKKHLSKVFLVIYATFLQRALDNVFHDVCLQCLPVVFAIDRAFLSGPDGPTHHGIYDIGFLYAMPNLILTQPRCQKVLEELMEESIYWKNPAAIRYPNLPATPATFEENRPYQKRPVGKAEVLHYGQDFLLITLGHMYKLAFAAKTLLEEHGLNPTIVDPIYLKPLDKDLFLQLLRKNNRVVVLEEHSCLTGLGSIIEHFAQSNKIYNIQLLSIGVPDTFLPHGQRDKLLEKIGFTPKAITEKILQHFSWKQVAKV